MLLLLSLCSATILNKIRLDRNHVTKSESMFICCLTDFWKNLSYTWHCRQKWYRLLDYTYKFISAAKKSYYFSPVHSSSTNPRTLWKTINNILDRTAIRFLPTSLPLAALPQLFATYLCNKISKLHFNLQTNPSSTPAPSLPSSPPPLLYSFTPATLT